MPRSLPLYLCKSTNFSANNSIFSRRKTKERQQSEADAILKIEVLVSAGFDPRSARPFSGPPRMEASPAQHFSAAVLHRLRSATFFPCTFGLTQKYQKVKHYDRDRTGLRLQIFREDVVFTTFCHQKVAPKVSARHLRRDRTTVLTERARKTALFAAQKDAPLRLWRLGKVRKRPLPSPATVVRTPAPGVRTAVRSVSACGALRMLRCASRKVVLFSGRPAACLLPRCENVGRRSCRTPSARNDRAISIVFRDRSARCATVSRSFSPRGLLWLFLRKKEHEKTSCEKCGTKSAKQAPQPLRSSLKSAKFFSLYFWLDPKVQKSQARRKDAGAVAGAR